MSDTDATEVFYLPVDQLTLDHRNPRLVEFGIKADATETEILKTLWEEMDVQELVYSIAQNGYFAHEPLIVTEEGSVYTVIEGNRRLSALKVLLHPEIARENNWYIPEIDEDRRDSIREVPVINQARETSWRYLGYKHINGPAKWTSFAKAKYIAEHECLVKASPLCG